MSSMNDTTPLSPDPGLTFWGAAAAVSGSMHLLDAPRAADVSRSSSDRSRVLLDCGMYQGKREVARERNEKFPFHPRQLTAVIVSHGHIDHCGNLPTLVKQGFTGPIFATPATRDLIRVMLRDSARIQEEDAAHLNIARNYAEPWVEPLYTAADVEETFRRIIGVPYGKETEAAPGVRFTLTEAGHILGSALVHMVIDAPDRKRTLTFSGDLGRRGLPLLKPAGDVPPADLLVCESTYGNRKHEPVGGTIEKLYAVVRDTVERGGKVLIPAFSLGRCQLIIHFLQQGLRAGKVPRVPVYVDSPLASNVAEVYRSHPDALHPEVAVGVREGHGILGGDGVEYVRSGEESQQLATRPGPCVVIASSGMCDAGRIVNHLKHNVDDPRSTVALAELPGSRNDRPASVGGEADHPDRRQGLEQVDRRGPPGRVQRARRQGRLPGVPDAAGGKGRQGPAHSRGARTGGGVGRDAAGDRVRRCGRPGTGRPGDHRLGERPA